MAGVRDGAAGAQVVDLVSGESQLFQHLFAVFANLRGPLCRYLSDTVHLHRTADRELQISSGTLQRNDDVVLPELRVADDFTRRPHDAECDLRTLEDFAPMRHRL